MSGGGTWTRVYPQGSLFSQPVGYFIASESQKAGLEEQYSGQLEGTPSGISSVFGPLGNQQQVGDDIDTTLDPRAQLQARSLLAGRIGSVVAFSTADVLVFHQERLAPGTTKPPDVSIT